MNYLLLVLSIRYQLSIIQEFRFPHLHQPPPWCFLKCAPSSASLGTLKTAPATSTIQGESLIHKCPRSLRPTSSWSDSPKRIYTRMEWIRFETSLLAFTSNCPEELSFQACEQPDLMKTKFCAPNTELTAPSSMIEGLLNVDMGSL